MSDLLVSSTRPIGASRVNTYVLAIVVLSISAIIGVVTISILLRGDPERGSIMTMLLGVISPIVAALLAAALKEVHTDVNSRLTEFLELTARASKAEGMVDGERSRRGNSETTRQQEVLKAASLLKEEAQRAATVLKEDASEAKATLKSIEANTAETAAGVKELKNS